MSSPRTDAFVDYVYEAQGTVHAGHAYQLYAALKAIPWLGLNDDYDVRPWGFEGGGASTRDTIRVSALRIRARVSHLEQALRVEGRTLRIGQHQVRLGRVSVEPLVACEQLYAPAVYLHSAKQGRGKGRMDQDITPEELRQVLLRMLQQELGVRYPRISIGRRRRLGMGARTAHIGYAVALQGLDEVSSIKVQQARIAGRTHLGGGIFLPGELPRWLQADHQQRGRQTRTRSRRSTAQAQATQRRERLKKVVHCDRWSQLVAEELG